MRASLFNRFGICVLSLVFSGVNIPRVLDSHHEQDIHHTREIHQQHSYLDWIRPGTGLTYQVNTEGCDYQYIVVIKSLYPLMSFRWDMTFPSRNWGNVEISQQAMDEATAQRNYFSGSDLYLEDETSVWVSKKVYQALQAHEPVSINCGDSNEDELLFFVKNTTCQIQLNDSTVLLPALYAETEKGNKYWILDDPDNPIILKMTIKFNIQLENIMTEEYLGRD